MCSEPENKVASNFEIGFHSVPEGFLFALSLILNILYHTGRIG